MLEIREVSHRYHRDLPWALEDVSFTVPPGTVYGLLGPNGAGKTTLMSLVAGLRYPSQGTLQWEGGPLDKVRLALVPQDQAFYPTLTCRENLVFFAGVLNLSGIASTSRIDYAIAFAGLNSVLERRAEQCSGGLKRRLNLAIGVLGDPDLLLLDEPTVGVDPQSRAFMLEAIAELGKAGKTVIYASHYMDEVEAVCERVAIIDHGHLLREGPLTRLLDVTHREALLRTALPLPKALLTALAMFGAVEAAGDRRYRLSLAPGAALAPPLALIEQHGVEVTGVSAGTQDLETLFLQLTHRSLRD